jgi:hypothetical protein
MPFYWLGMVVGFLAFEALAPRSATSLFIALYHGEPLTAAWPLVLSGFLCITAVLLGHLGSLLWLVVAKGVLGLNAEEVREVEPSVDKDFAQRPLYRRRHNPREP